MSSFTTGLVSLGDWLPDPRTGVRQSEAARFRQLVQMGVLAEQLGFDTYHVGEHHFSHYILSSPVPVLAAVAERTERIRLSTAVSLLTHRDPVTVAEDYATVDVLSGGRVELVAGRGVYRTHYAQFGQDAEQSPQMLAEQVALLKRLWTEEDVHWQGTYRTPLDGVTTHPRPVQRPHPPIWLSASSLDSVDRAVALGCPIVVPTVSVGVAGPPSLVERYRAAWKAAGRRPEDARVALHTHCFTGAGSTAEAVEQWAPHQHSYLSWVLGEVGRPGPLPPHFEELATPNAQAVCGSVADAAADLIARIRACGGVDHLMVQMDQGGLPPAEVEAAATRWATEVLPRVRAGVGV